MAIEGVWQGYLHMAKESVWGTAVGTDIWIPYQTYDVMASPSYYSADTHIGIRQRKHPSVMQQIDYDGTLLVDAYGYQINSRGAGLKSIVQHLLDWALSGPASVEQDSFTAVKYAANDTKLHVGLRVNTLTISGQASGPIQMSLSLMGKDESTATASSLVAATPHYTPMMFRDATFLLAGSSATLNSFSLTINNNLQKKYNNSPKPSIIAQGRRTIDYTFNLDVTANTYDALRRSTADPSSITGRLTLLGTHHGTATNNDTTVQIDIDAMQFAGAGEGGSIDQIREQSPSYVVLKPNSSDNDIDVTYGTAA